MLIHNDPSLAFKIDMIEELNNLEDKLDRLNKESEEYKRIEKIHSQILSSIIQYDDRYRMLK